TPHIIIFETTKEIRNFAKEDMPIIILTSYNWEDIETDAKRAGVDSFVAKPLFAGSVLDEFAEAYAKKNKHPVRKKKELKNKRILLAEDIQINAEIMASLLSMKEMKVEHAENGRVAVEMFETHEEGYYDAILMDMRMPEMDGLEASKKIRSMDRKDAKEIPIIALTANAFDEDVQRSMQAGLNAHLSKPVEPEQLFTTLQTLIKEKTEE
ncbi:MAG: response regulator, partial [Erysipelotrichaceae bacterium]|nr:response regulator [Erysipelotrichaceae bacterium]